jgi:lipopolysaccharide transport system ATP-binding protein
MIRARRLGKQYRIGQQQQYRTLRESIVDAVRAPLARLTSGAWPAQDATFWALKDISFEVPSGQAVGIIGRNGAGKSTLLKVLSRVTEPTTGRVELFGRIASLLEVGTGFHPELTGRENIFLNGALLGMRRADIARKLDEIVAFSEIERFLDTPVKRYSSGMYVRLAFAVAAHLEPDVLVVDEVLAVGDASFQKKCLGKLEDVAGHGRTVLFVSHNMPAVTRLCSRAILLQEGQLVNDGPSAQIVGEYLTGVAKSGATRSWPVDQAPGTAELRLTSVSLIGADGLPVAAPLISEPLQLRVGYRTLVPGLRFRCSVLFFTQGVCAFAAVEPIEEERARPADYYSTLMIPPDLLAEGDYTVQVSLFASRGSKSRFAIVRDAVAFYVTDPLTGSSARGDYAEAMLGVMRPKLEWQLGFAAD